MSQKSLGITVVLAGIIFILLWGAFDGWGYGRTTISLLSATNGATGGNYDSLDEPLGTSYQVPASMTLHVEQILVSADTASSTTVEWGYGDTHVEDSVAAPTNAVTVGSFTLLPGAELETVTVAGTMPAGKYPFARVSGPATWPSRVTLYGVEK